MRQLKSKIFWLYMAARELIKHGKTDYSLKRIFSSSQEGWYSWNEYQQLKGAVETVGFQQMVRNKNLRR